MNLGTAIHILGQIDQIARAHGVIDAAGNFHETDAQGWTKLAVDVEAQLKMDGVAIPEKLDVFIRALPAILMLLGV
jgi:hypothetical protein